MILASVEKCPLVWPSITIDCVIRLKEYTELTPAEAIQADCDIRAINIILQGLPTKIYALVTQQRVSQGSLGEEYAHARNSLTTRTDLMPLEQFQVDTKFLNTLPDEWSKFVTDVKLVKDLHTTNVDQLHAYLEQHERHANEVHLMHELTYPSNDFQSSIHHNVYSPSSSIPQLEYAPQINQQSEFSQQDSGLIVPVFQKGDAHIDAINHMMSFFTAIVTSRYPTTNNQLRNSSNHRQQATINNGRVTLPQFQGRKTSCCEYFRLQLQEQLEEILENRGRLLLTTAKGKATSSSAVHQTKEKDDDSWFKEKFCKSKPKLYVGDIIVQTNPIVIPDLEETLALAEESRSKMLLKHKDNMMLEKEKQNSVNSSEPTLSVRPTNVEVPKELPKVSMVIFQRENSISNQSVPSFDQLFELNELKAQSQEKDTVIMKLKERIESLSGNMDKDKIKQDLEEIETINIELDHRVTKLIAEIMGYGDY
ncbi:hypothetical protein Tco_1044617 [Tanacetum coccineum]|uniref:Integrase, catalytic region, zinc finger, CCHC-type, peptidase aspartic, catalytic n=1 Tax=Tanacetum coccineum TaxID=301880 RepID=A0ABQ5GSE2_9ASTR